MFWKWFKRIFKYLGLLLLILAVFYYQSLFYGIRQLYGQLSLIYNTEKISDVLQRPTLPDSLRQKLLLIEEIRLYAFDSLGLQRNNNYTTYYDQHNQPLLWNVTACAPYSFQDYEWSFPFFGKFSYKGYFSKAAAEEETNRLKAEGWDVSVDPVSGWSTLGWFSDPVLSNFLKRSPGKLANLIIHELTHGTLYVKDNVTYNENLADFIGHLGAQKFLTQKYGSESPELMAYKKDIQREKAYGLYVLAWRDSLQNFYGRISHKGDQRANLKKAKLASIRQSLEDKLRNLYPERARISIDSLSFNNTYFSDFDRYQSRQAEFEKEFFEQYHGDFKVYFQALKEKYGSL